MGFHDTMNTFDDIRHSTKMSTEWFVEDTQYQHAAIEEMERRAFSVEPMRPIKDKRARLRVAARYQERHGKISTYWVRAAHHTARGTGD
jgi:hypothetical protein